MTALELHAVRGSLGRRPVGPYTFQVHPGETVALVGANGSGKTTGLHYALGLRRATAGRVVVHGEPVGPTRPPVDVGAALLDDGLDPDLTARADLALLAPLRRPDPGIDEVLAVVGLAHAADAPAGAFSAGMVRRLGLARALLGRPSLLVLDEPTASLDDAAGTWLAALLHELNDDGVAIVLTSHDPAFLTAVGGRRIEVARCRTS